MYIRAQRGYMDFTLMWEITPLLLRAAWVTVSISVLAFILGLFLATLLVIMRSSALRIVRWPARIYISVMRGTPFFVQLLIFYYGGSAFGINLEAYTAGLLAMGLNIAAYMSEAIRGSILAVNSGQNEASRSLGFSRLQTMMSITLPQAAGLMVRSLGVLGVILIKGSSLVSIISVVELTYQSQRIISSTYKPFEVFAVSAVLYLVLIYGVISFVDWLYNRYTRYLFN
jgi:polar amino acid transport system permease protein